MQTAHKIGDPADEAAAPIPEHPPIDEARRGQMGSPQARIVPDRRRYHRVEIRLLGRFMRENRQEYPCQVINMSPGDVAMLAPVAGDIGEHIVVYIDQIGRIEGEVTRVLDGGFAMSIKATSYKREKIANQLTWLINRDRLSLAEDRRYERLVPKNPFIKIKLPDGTEQNCRVLDVSLSGASVAINPKPPVGANVVLGLMRGKVVRHHENGVGIEFVDVQDRAAIRRHFGESDQL